MNVDTGELRRFKEQQAKELMKQGFVPVPSEHREEANQELGDKESTYVDLKKDSPLVNWAKQVKASKKKKAKTKIVKTSRRRNRR